MSFEIIAQGGKIVSSLEGSKAIHPAC